MQLESKRGFSLFGATFSNILAFVVVGYFCVDVSTAPLRFSLSIREKDVSKFIELVVPFALAVTTALLVSTSVFLLIRASLWLREGGILRGLYMVSGSVAPLSSPQCTNCSSSHFLEVSHCVNSPSAPTTRQIVSSAALIAAVTSEVGLSYVSFSRGLNQPLPRFITAWSPVNLNTAAGAVYPFHITSSYGLFRRMTTTRKEIILQGRSPGSKLWKSFEFKYKPGDLDRRPEWMIPHQPRVDWQMWFASLSPSFQQSPFLIHLVAKLFTCKYQTPWSQLPILSCTPSPFCRPLLFYRILTNLHDFAFPFLPCRIPTASPGAYGAFDADRSPFSVDNLPSQVRGIAYLYEFSKFEDKAAMKLGRWYTRSDEQVFVPVFLEKDKHRLADYCEANGWVKTASDLRGEGYTYVSC